MDDWVRFKVTTRALKEIDNVGGIDNYILSLGERQVQDSNYITKIRNLIGTTLFHQGLLCNSIIKRLGYHKNPPTPINSTVVEEKSTTNSTNVTSVINKNIK